MKLNADYDKLQDALVLSEAQRATLGQYIRTEGFALILRMWRDEVRKFTEIALGSDMADDKSSLEALRKAKVAAQLFQGWVDRLNQELELLDTQSSSIGTQTNPENYNAIAEFGGEEI
jgi:hypothetical protein